MAICALLGGLLTPSVTYAGSFSLDGFSCSGTASGTASGTTMNGGTHNSVNGVQLSDTGGNYSLPSNTTAITLRSQINKRNWIGHASAHISSCSFAYGFLWHATNEDDLMDPAPHDVIVKVSVKYNTSYGMDSDGDGTVHGKVLLAADTEVDGADPLPQDNPVSVNAEESDSPPNANVGYAPGDRTATTYFFAHPSGGSVLVYVYVTDIQTGLDITGERIGDSSHNSNTASITVTPTVTVTPVTIDLNGTTQNPNDGSRNILIGQGCIVWVDAGSYTLTNYAWQINGDPFKFYVAYGPSRGDNTAHVIPLESSDFAQPYIQYFYRSSTASEQSPAPDTESIAATFTVADGSTTLGRLTASQSLNVFRPGCACATFQDATFMYWFGGGAKEYLEAGREDADPEGPVGIEWDGEVLRSDLMESASPGIWSFVQVVYINRQKTEGVASSHWETIPQYGLDARYPYAPASSDRQDNDDAGWEDGTQLYASNDNPGLPLEDAWDAVQVDEYMETYIMYRPADVGAGHQWVPLHLVRWHWTADKSKNGGPWLQSNQVIPVGIVQTTDNVTWQQHPTWLGVVNCAAGQWVPN